MAGGLQRVEKLSCLIDQLNIEKKEVQSVEVKYFPNGHVKQGYALFESPGTDKPEQWKLYVIKAMQGVTK